MKAKYPFKFLNSYDKEDAGVFFGRDEEINELYEMVFQSSVILVYGASGTGKTSLIDCGLAGKFQPHDWLALMVRRGVNINDSLEKVLKSEGGEIATVTADTNYTDEWSDDSPTTTKELSKIAQSIKAIYQKSFRPVYLIFDQFEELFILGTAAELDTFIQTVHDILQSEQPVKIIFAIREEYLGYLFEFERAVPQLMRKKLRIEPMNFEKVKQVIIGASSFENSNVKLKAGEEDQLAKGIFDKIKGKGKSLTIQLPFLQVFLDKFYLHVTGDESRTAEAVFTMKALNEMGEIGDVLINFLDEQVAVISKNLLAKYPDLTQDMTWRMLSPFSTIEGTKEPISKQGLRERLTGVDPKMIDDIITAFTNSRILRYNEATDMFEIAHDALAKPISEKRSVEEKTLLEIKRLIKSQVAVKADAREYFTERQLIFIEPYLDKIKISDEEKDWISKSRAYNLVQKETATKQQLADLNKKRRQRILTVAIVLLLLFVSLFIYLAIKAQNEKIIADQERVKADVAKERAKELLRLVMKGKGDQYENKSGQKHNTDLSDSLLEMRLDMEQNYPIDSLIIPKASVSRSNKGGENRNYMLWIDVPSFRKHEIKEVQYHLCKGFVDQLRVSEEPSSSFSVGYLGWGYCPVVNIDILLNNRSDTIKKIISFDDYFKTHPLSD